MFRTFLVSTFLAIAVAALTSSSAHAYGAVHAGRTTMTPTGVQHYGATAAVGPYGSASHTGSTTASGGTVTHTGSTSATGAYGGAYSGSSTRTYSPTAYGGYSATGARTVSTTGVVRYP